MRSTDPTIHCSQWSNHPFDPICQSIIPTELTILLIYLACITGALWAKRGILRNPTIHITYWCILLIRSINPTIHCSQWSNHPFDPICQSIIPTELTILLIYLACITGALWAKRGILRNPTIHSTYWSILLIRSINPTIHCSHWFNYPIDPIYRSKDPLLSLIWLSYQSDVSFQGSVALADLTVLSIPSTDPLFPLI